MILHFLANKFEAESMTSQVPVAFMRTHTSNWNIHTTITTLTAPDMDSQL